MKVRKAFLIVADDVHRHALMDVIEYRNEFWLVPEWLDNQVQKSTKPLRIVSLRTIPHQRLPGQIPEFVVNDPVPKYVFDGRIPPEQAGKYVVVEDPDIRILIARRDVH
jgi:hypothetical protein